MSKVEVMFPSNIAYTEFRDEFNEVMEFNDLASTEFVDSLDQMHIDSLDFYLWQEEMEFLILEHGGHITFG